MYFKWRLFICCRQWWLGSNILSQFISKLSKDRDPIKAISLTVDTSIITAIGNDYGFEIFFQDK